jgi:hypothetical protein
MSGHAATEGTRSNLETRVRHLAVATPTAALAAGVTAAALQDFRAAFVAAAFIIGWTQLAGL